MKGSLHEKVGKTKVKQPWKVEKEYLIKGESRESNVTETKNIKNKNKINLK